MTTTVPPAAATLRDLHPEIARRAGGPGDLDPWTAEQLRRTGATRAVLPIADGGEGAGLAQASAILRTLASADASAALILAMQYIHLQRLRESAEPAAAEVLARVAATGGLVNVAASEQLTGAPSDGGVIRTVATPSGSGWTLSGRKRWVTGSVHLDRILVTASVPTGVAPRAAGEAPPVRTFVVDPRGPGVRIVPAWDAIGLVGSASHDVVLDGAPALADLGAAHPPGSLDSFVLWWSVLLGSVHLGLAQAARVEALAHASGERYDGVPGTLADLSRVQNRAGRLDLELHQVTVLLDAAIAREHDEDVGTVAQATKLLVHEHATAAVEHATKLVGGAAVRRSSVLARIFLDLRAAAFNPPREEAVVAAVGRRALGLTPAGRP